MTHQLFLPALEQTMERRLSLAGQKRAISSELSDAVEVDALKTLSVAQESIYEKAKTLRAEVEKNEGETDELKKAKVYQSRILPLMEELRAAADGVEHMIPSDLQPYPTYADMLFYV